MQRRLGLPEAPRRCRRGLPSDSCPEGEREQRQMMPPRPPRVGPAAEPSPPDTFSGPCGGSAAYSSAQDFPKLHGDPHVALNLQLAHHERHLGVLLARCDILKV